jgi:hypothetical protein
MSALIRRPSRSILKGASRALHILTLGAALASCGDSDPEPGPAARDSGADEADGSPPSACTLPPDCRDYKTPFASGSACCSATTPCGYTLSPVDEETKMYFPDLEPFLEQITMGDPNRCAPEWYTFGSRPGLYDHRVEVEPEIGEDILVAESCESFTVLAFILPGCCMPDNRCGLSTDESWPTFESFVEGKPAPFTKPECVSATELNQQFRDSGTLADFARLKESGMSCDYAALAEKFPPFSP